MNKYLTKISGIVSGTYHRVLKPVAGVAGDILKDIGHSYHSALGGDFRDAAVNLHGITHQPTLRAIHDQKSYIEHVHARSPLQKGGLFKKAIPRDIHQLIEEAKALQSDKNKGIIKAIGYTGVGIYGSNKVLNKVREYRDSRDQQQYDQYYQQ